MSGLEAKELDINLSVNVFLTGICVNNLKPLYVHAKIKPIRKYLIDTKNQVSPCWRKNFQTGEGERPK